MIWKMLRWRIGKLRASRTTYLSQAITSLTNIPQINILNAPFLEYAEFPGLVGSRLFLMIMCIMLVYAPHTYMYMRVRGIHTAYLFVGWAWAKLNEVKKHFWKVGSKSSETALLFIVLISDTNKIFCFSVDIVNWKYILTQCMKSAKQTVQVLCLSTEQCTLLYISRQPFCGGSTLTGETTVQSPCLFYTSHFVKSGPKGAI